MQMKNKILSILVLTTFILPVSAEVLPIPVDTKMVDTSQVETLETPLNIMPPEDMDPNSFPHKQPISKKKIAKMFLLAMGGVATSSLIIILILSLYNKVREGFKSNIKACEGETSLETPDDLQSAVRKFLDKTTWKN